MTAFSRSALIRSAACITDLIRARGLGWLPWGHSAPLASPGLKDRPALLLLLGPVEKLARDYHQ